MPGISGVLTQSLGIAVTVLIFTLAKHFQRASRLAMTHPLLLSVALLALGLYWTGIPYSRYFASVRIVHFLLGPATVALGFPLAASMREAKRWLPSLIASVGVGAVLSTCAGLLMMESGSAGKLLSISMAAKSATTPIAIHIAEDAGGDAATTAVFAIAAGVLVAATARPILRVMRISNRIVVGAACGTAGSGIGAAEAANIDKTAGAFAGLAIGLTGLFTSLAVPAVSWVFKTLVSYHHGSLHW